MLKKQKGNMYEFVTHMWGPIRGKCSHNCSYCYMKKWGPQKPIRFDEKELQTDLGSGNFIFVGSSCDMWAEDIREKWIIFTLHHCSKFNNKYLFQSKNPQRIYEFTDQLPGNVVLGSTIETNRYYKSMRNAPHPLSRAAALLNLMELEFLTMVTIEPIMDFDIDTMLYIIDTCNPNWVNIGANTNSKVQLPEPPSEKINVLIKRLKEITKVRIKPNLKRLLDS